jgi:hypothetical protein
MSFRTVLFSRLALSAHNQTYCENYSDLPHRPSGNRTWVPVPKLPVSRVVSIGRRNTNPESTRRSLKD